MESHEFERQLESLRVSQAGIAPAKELLDAQRHARSLLNNLVNLTNAASIMTALPFTL